MTSSLWLEQWVSCVSFIGPYHMIDIDSSVDFMLEKQWTMENYLAYGRFYYSW